MSSLTNATANASAGAAPAWRQYAFFDVVSVKDAHDLDSPPDIFKATPEISTVVSSSFGVLVADIHGSIHLLNEDFESTMSWVAHTGGRVTHMIERKGMLVTLGEEDAVRSPLLKIWDLSSKDPKVGAPALVRSIKVQQSNRPHPVSTVALTSSLSHLAIGLGDGTVLLYRHLDQSLSTSNSLTALPKPRTAHESPTEPITGLGFREPTADDTAGSTTGAGVGLALFVVTTNRVLAYPVTGKGSGGAAVVVDEIGCALGCATMDWKARDIVVARDEAIYACGTEGRGACYAYEGTKSSVHTHLNYLVLVSPPFVPSASAASATVRNFVARTGDHGGTDITKVTVFEPENKYVAYSGTFTSDVREVFSQWGKIYVLTGDGKLVCLQEKSTSAKLDMLYRKSLYTLALSLAKTQGLEEASVADIRRQYGDHLYTKGDYDGAMQQFVLTIGHLQPSYVIRKFLDAQRIHNLVTYLQELHSLGLANADHTTLLLNTYTKLKDVTRLDAFIRSEAKRGTDATGELPFDLDTAIRVCRQAGYPSHAAYLARKYERHEEYLRIQIEDVGEYGEALGYLARLGPEAAESNLARYGRAMLDSLPHETTQLLIDLCTNSTLPKPSIPAPEPETEADPTSAATAKPTGGSYLSYLALNRTSLHGATASETATATPTPPSPSIKTVKPDSGSRRDSLRAPSRASTPPVARPPSVAASGPTPAVQVQQKEEKRKRLSPRVYFAHFVDHMEQFVFFLETVAVRRWGQSVDEDHEDENEEDEKSESEEVDEEDKADQVAVWNTLLELYLTLPGPGSSTPKGASTNGGVALDEATLRKKAIRLLTSDSIPYDPTHALILCSTRGYTDGLVLLWEKMGMYEDVLRFWIDKYHSSSSPDSADASHQVIAQLEKYGAENPHLYPLVLRFLTSTPELLASHTEDVKEMLEYVDQEGILTPLGVVQLLSRNGVASVGLVKEWLVERIREGRTEVQNDRELINSYRLETAAKLKQVKDLEDTEHPRVFHVTRCSTCAGQLDLPSVHFMCNHSYHQRCLAENDTECPNCAREHGVIREIRRNNERLADQHEVFLSEVREGGFDAVAAAFSRGVLNVTRPDVSVGASV